MSDCERPRQHDRAERDGQQLRSAEREHECRDELPGELGDPAEVDDVVDHAYDDDDEGREQDGRDLPGVTERGTQRRDEPRDTDRDEQRRGTSRRHPAAVSGCV